MAIIGKFSRSGDGFEGKIETLKISAKKVRFVPETGSTSEKAPSHRLFAGEAEVGAAWRNLANGDKRPSLSVKLDDPSFTAAVHAVLVERPDGGFDLIWTRQAKRPRG